MLEGPLGGHDASVFDPGYEAKFLSALDQLKHFCVIIYLYVFTSTVIRSRRYITELDAELTLKFEYILPCFHPNTTGSTF